MLVVDDDESLRLLCRVNLELDGYRVLEACRRIAEARRCSQPSGVDAMLLDLHLGDGDGRDLLASSGADRPPVALFTGSEPIGRSSEARRRRAPEAVRDRAAAQRRSTVWCRRARRR